MIFKRFPSEESCLQTMGTHTLYVDFFFQKSVFYIDVNPRVFHKIKGERLPVMTDSIWKIQYGDRMTLLPEAYKPPVPKRVGKTQDIINKIVERSPVSPPKSMCFLFLHLCHLFLQILNRHLDSHDLNVLIH